MPNSPSHERLYEEARAAYLSGDQSIERFSQLSGGGLRSHPEGNLVAFRHHHAFVADLASQLDQLREERDQWSAEAIEQRQARSGEAYRAIKDRITDELDQAAGAGAALAVGVALCAASDDQARAAQDRADKLQARVEELQKCADGLFDQFMGEQQRALDAEDRLAEARDHSTELEDLAAAVRPGGPHPDYEAVADSLERIATALATSPPNGEEAADQAATPAETADEFERRAEKLETLSASHAGAAAYREAAAFIREGVGENDQRCENCDGEGDFYCGWEGCPPFVPCEQCNGTGKKPAPEVSQDCVVTLRLGRETAEILDGDCAAPGFYNAKIIFRAKLREALSDDPRTDGGDGR